MNVLKAKCVMKACASNHVTSWNVIAGKTVGTGSVPIPVKALIVPTDKVVSMVYAASMTVPIMAVTTVSCVGVDSAYLTPASRSNVVMVNSVVVVPVSIPAPR